ncbi:hypothetical protein TKK_0016028 [Trichogramma kaykai]
MALRAVEMTSLMASIVDRPFRKPYCRSERPPGLSVKASSRSHMIISRILPAVSNIHSGRYEDGSSGGLPDVGIRTSFWRFQLDGKTPVSRLIVYTRKKMSGRTATSSLSAMLGYFDKTVRIECTGVPFAAPVRRGPGRSPGVLDLKDDGLVVAVCVPPTHRP